MEIKTFVVSCGDVFCRVDHIDAKSASTLALMNQLVEDGHRNRSSRFCDWVWCIEVEKNEFTEFETQELLGDMAKPVETKESLN